MKAAEAKVKELGGEAEVLTAGGQTAIANQVSQLNDLVAKLIPESIGREIEKAAEGVYPLQNVLIRKVVTLRAPKTDMAKLLELHSGSVEQVQDLGKAVERPAETKA